MLCIQFSIGALNDAVDAPIDRRQKPWKPVARGLVSARSAVLGAVVMGAIGLLVSISVDVAAAAVIGVGLGLGWIYDLWLSRTAWSWLPLALALPVVPIHAWLGATGTVSPGLVTIVPAAVLAGAALAISNGLVDVERDARSDRPAFAVWLGFRRAWWVHALLLAAVVLLAVLVAPAPSAAAGALALLRSGGIALGAVMLGLGGLLVRAPDARLRERGWELEAVGIAASGVGWLGGTAGT